MYLLDTYIGERIRIFFCVQNFAMHAHKIHHPNSLHSPIPPPLHDFGLVHTSLLLALARPIPDIITYLVLYSIVLNG